MQRNVKVNYIVFLYDSNTSRSFWLLARVVKVHPSKDELVRSVKLKLPNITLVRTVNQLCLLEESTWIHLNEFSVGVEECCVYWHCKKRKHRNVTLSVVRLSAAILVPFASIYLHFSTFLSVLFWGVAAKVMSCSQKCLVIFSSSTFIFATSSKFKVLNYLKLVVTLAFTVVLLVLSLAKR